MTNAITAEVEKVFEEMKAELMKLFGDHANLHNVINDAKQKVSDITTVENVPKENPNPTTSSDPTT